MLTALTVLGVLSLPAAPAVGPLDVEGAAFSDAERTALAESVDTDLAARAGIAYTSSQSIAAALADADDVDACRRDVACLRELGDALGLDHLLLLSVEEVATEFHVRARRIPTTEDAPVSETVSVVGSKKDVAQQLELCAAHEVRIFSPGTGHLVLNTDGVDADVTVDGEAAPADGQVKSGVVQVDATADGFQSVSMLVDVPADGERTVEVKMIPTEEYLSSFVVWAWVWRATALALLGTGAVVTLAGAGALVGSYFAAAFVSEQIRMFNEQPVRTAEAQDALLLQKNLINFGLTPGGVAAAVVGPILMAAGAAVLVFADGPGKYE